VQGTCENIHKCDKISRKCMLLIPGVVFQNKRRKKMEMCG